MTASMLKRLERLERRQPVGKPWTDPFESAARLLERFQAGERIEAPPLAPEAEPAFELLMREVDRMATRLAQERKMAAPT
jgi:hypothetical protein